MPGKIDEHVDPVGANPRRHRIVIERGDANPVIGERSQPLGESVAAPTLIVVAVDLDRGAVMVLEDRRDENATECKRRSAETYPTRRRRFPA